MVELVASTRDYRSITFKCGHGGIKMGKLNHHNLEPLERRQLLSVEPSLAGDADLDGHVDGDDFGRLNPSAVPPVTVAKGIATITGIAGGSIDDHIVISTVADSSAPGGANLIVTTDSIVTDLAGQTITGFRINTNGGDDRIEFKLPPQDRYAALHNTIYAGDGDDIIIGSAGLDRIYCGLGNDTVSGFGGADRIYGDVGVDVISAGSGSDYVRGDYDNDNIAGGNGNDRLYGDFGDDAISGGSHNDHIEGGPGDDFILCGAGKDLVLADTGRNTCYGGEGADRLIGGQDRDELYGGAGADTLEGGYSADKLIGGSGFDHDDTSFNPANDEGDDSDCESPITGPI